MEPLCVSLTAGGAQRLVHGPVLDDARDVGVSGDVDGQVAGDVVQAGARLRCLQGPYSGRGGRLCVVDEPVNHRFREAAAGLADESRLRALRGRVPLQQGGAETGWKESR